MSSNWTNYSVNVRSDETSAPQAVTDEGPACTSCKKRKLRCSRETPACSHCVRLSLHCAYAPKQKPGLKTGALEGLTRRVAFLERILLDDEGRIRPGFEPDDETEGTQFQSESQCRVEETAPSQDHGIPSEDLPHASELRSDSAHSQVPAQPREAENHYRKRKLDQPALLESLFAFETIDITEHLPSQLLLSKAADFFCISFHHWIPFVHKQRLQDSVSNGRRGTTSSLVLHAVVAATLRHMDPRDIFLDEDEVTQQTRISQSLIEAFAMRNVSLDSLRALIILVFIYLNDGDANKAWPLIGSMTRTVDYLQLTVEPTACHSGALMSPLQQVQPTQDWTELEERRRLFWVIFLLDRFCSVSTGWNTSLTSEDVHRRLPADGGYFTREEPVTTPFFGIWNKTAAKIGRSLAHVPAQYNEDDPTADQVQGTSPGSANSLIDSSKLGAFAYCVEATESLSQVTTFFLGQRINWQDKEHAIGWLTRFKELDLRLVQWKMFLPPRWKDSDISQDTHVVDMDPNLTLAHITHNTSMILLHHAIAYPPREWSNYVALPKECSAQTCQHAAVETSNIVGKFLAHTRIPFVNVQFAFCSFIAAKALLFEHSATQRNIRPEFARLVHNLWEMSLRWSGKRGADLENSGDFRSSASNQAGRYAHHLEYLFEACNRSPTFAFDFYDHSCQRHTSPSSDRTHVASHHSNNTRGSFNNRPRGLRSSIASHSAFSPRALQSPIHPRQSPISATASVFSSDGNTPHAPLPLPSYPGPSSTSQMPAGTPSMYAAPPNQAMDSNALNQQHNGVPDQSLIDLSDTLMGSQFLDMDRVITFEDANFFLPGDAFRWQ